MLEELKNLSASIRLLFVQYGDYLEGVRALEGSVGETYAAQRYTVEFVAELAKRFEQVTVLTFARDYEPTTLPSGVRCMGVKLYPEGKRARHARLIAACAMERPTHMVVCAPLTPLLASSALTPVRVLPLFADSFQTDDRKQALKHSLLGKLLSTPSFEWISNHNLAASLDLVRIGVKANKVVPFDWPQQNLPSDRAAKTSPASADALRLMYVGSQTELKGVGDAIRAIAELRDRGRNVSLGLVGTINEEFVTLANELSVDDRVHFLGRHSNTQVLTMMNEHDAVIVPSQHAYPEGLPMTIYEALCSRSPVIVSDHPMFRLRMRHEENCLVFPASSSSGLADAVEQLADDPALYARLSAQAETAADNYVCPLQWHRLLLAWLSDDPSVRAGLREYAIDHARYADDLRSANAAL